MNLGSAPYYIFSAFSITMLPLVTTALRDGDKARASRLVARNVSFLIMVVSPVVGIVLAAAPSALLDFVYPSVYRVGAAALCGLIVSQSLLAVIASLTSAITAKNRPRVAMAVWLVCIPVQVGLGFVVIPRFGMAGAAVANLATTVVGVAIAGVLTFRYFGLPFEPVPRHQGHRGVGGRLLAYVAAQRLLSRGAAVRLPRRARSVRGTHACDERNHGGRGHLAVQARGRRRDRHRSRKRFVSA